MKHQIQSEDVEAIIQMHKRKSKSKKIPKIPPLERYHTLFAFNLLQNYSVVSSFYFICFSIDDKFDLSLENEKLVEHFKVVHKNVDKICNQYVI